MKERVRIDGDGTVSPLQRLKNLSEAEQEFLLDQRQGDKAISVEKLLRQIEARHGISGLCARRWSEFAKWFEERQAIRDGNASVQNLREIYSGEQLTPDAVHDHLVKVLRVAGERCQDFKLLRFVTTELRAVMQLQHSREKWKEEQREKIDAGLAAVFEEIKGDPVAVELYEKIIGRIRPSAE